MSRPLDHPRRCQAHSSRTGQPCRRWAIKGGRVCPSHGARAPQVQQSARDRLMSLVDPAIVQMRKAIAGGDPVLAWRAARDVLRAAGLHEPERTDVVDGDRVRAMFRGLTAIVLEHVPLSEQRACALAMAAYGGLDARPMLPAAETEPEELVI